MNRSDHADRLDRLDAVRGLAMVWMTLFHFSFDLNQFHLIARQDFYRDPFWVLQRLCIVTMFLGCAGVAQAVAAQQGVASGRFWRRWARVAGCALLVSLGSMLMFPNSWISFGVLHAVAAMLLLVRFVPLGLWGWGAVAVAALLLPQWVAHPWFDTRWTNWLGLVTHKPVTEDYVPLLPWLGVMAAGLVAGHLMLRHRPEWLKGTLPRGLRPLAVLGRWSLSYYMIHQPVLIGLAMAAKSLGDLAGITSR